VALVGENGAGKSTLIKLLCRFYEASGGVISTDGIDVREFATIDLGREISPVFQDYYHFDLTAAQNIWLGNVTQPNDPERIMSAARLAVAEPGAGESAFQGRANTRA
jgi:ATP-binding cassette, subfamily B, bacterial